MFIRKVRTGTAKSGQSYFAYRLVKSQRVGDKVKQITLLNLGRNFTIEKDDWPLLCQRIEELLDGQATFDFLTIPTGIEAEARRIARQLLKREGQEPELSDLQTVDINSTQDSDGRSIGIEHAALEALKLLGLPNKICELGLNKRQQACALANIIGRMAQPGSERATNKWLRKSSALGEMLGIDFAALSDMALYRASDQLFRHKRILEAHVFDTAKTLFDLKPVVTLYDLTNTYFEGCAAAQPKAKRGHSKEKRKDAPLLTLGAVVDGSGFLKHTEVFPGNVVEAKTLATMLAVLKAPEGGIVVMDRGIATEDNLAWMRSQGYYYLVVSRSPRRIFDPLAEGIAAIATRKGEIATYLEYQDLTEQDGTAYQEVFLRCSSEPRQQKESGMIARFQERFEAGLQALHAGLTKPRTRKTLAYVERRIGRLQKANALVAQHYMVKVVADQARQKAVAIEWKLQPSAGSMMDLPGVYGLRSNLLDWDAKAMWKTYALLNDVEAVFRSLKSELGVRPIFHHKEVRADGHLFISVLAYQAIHVLRTRMKQAGNGVSWSTIRHALRPLQRTTTSFTRQDGRTLHVRKTAVADADQAHIYRAMQIAPPARNLRKTIV